MAVVASPLAIAALAQPLRRRIRGLIDRRFYRRRYDATRALEEFSRRLRRQVELASVCAGVMRVVQETLEPSVVGLWLRKPRVQ